MTCILGAAIARDRARVHNPAMLELVDIGLNLTHDSFDRDRDAVIAAALEAGVRRMIVTGTSITASAKATELSLSRPGVLFATAGIHPHHATELDSHGIGALAGLLEHEDVVAVGECGLDYYRNYSPKEDQLAAFEAQLELAAAVQKPVFLHQRDAHEDLLRLLARHRAGLAGGVAHCFTGNAEQLRAYLDLDLHIGITGWVADERRGEPLRRALASLPLERLLLETDAPYLMPRDLRPAPRHRRNEPKYLPHIASRAAAEMGQSADAVARASTLNAERLFALAAPRSQVGAG